MKIIEVKVPGTAAGVYAIQIGSGLLGSIVSEVGRAFPRYSQFLITDSALVRAGHVEKLVGSNSMAGRYVVEPGGEASKNMATVTAILEAMEACRLGRDTVVLALGGGVVGDMAGFAASVFKRGVPVVQIPTTTISQADSAIGGKTGVDSSVSKNAFGTFWYPAGVYVDVAALATLDERQYRSGLVESVKHTLIADAEYFEYLERNLDKVLARDEAVLMEVAGRNCRVKAKVVEKDPTEKNLRRVLNYGHTVGHAVESASGFELLHGECVAIGIVAAGKIEEAMGLVKDDRLGRIENMLKRLGQPTQMPANIDKVRVFELLKSDKKAIGQVARFVLLERIGRVHTSKGEYAVEVGEAVVSGVIGGL
jgi:3-dehydroquinate synthase